MGLREEWEKTGNFLFRWRSYLPLIFLPLVFLGLHQRLQNDDSVLWDREGWKVFCILVAFAGLGFRCWTVGWVSAQTSGRNTRKQVADRLNTKGIYSLVRHPLYVGNFLLFLGIVLWTQHGWLVVLGVLTFWFYYAAIMFAEEEFLRRKFGKAFIEWSKKTPAVVPRMWGWKNPRQAWSGRTVLRREHASFFALAATLASLELAENRFLYEMWYLSPTWVNFLAVSLGLYVILRLLKKKTKILDVPGR